jgi:hypothetical protein
MSAIPVLLTIVSLSILSVCCRLLIPGIGFLLPSVPFILIVHAGRHAPPKRALAGAMLAGLIEGALFPGAYLLPLIGLLVVLGLVHLTRGYWGLKSFGGMSINMVFLYSAYLTVMFTLPPNSLKPLQAGGDSVRLVVNILSTAIFGALSEKLFSAPVLRHTWERP